MVVPLFAAFRLRNAVRHACVISPHIPGCPTKRAKGSAAHTGTTDKLHNIAWRLTNSKSTKAIDGNDNERRIRASSLEAMEMETASVLARVDKRTVPLCGCIECKANLLRQSRSQ